MAASQKSSTKPLVIDPALALLEFSSIAAGIQAGDAMVKRAVLDVVHAGTVQPGRFLVLIGGSVAEVEEALKAGKESAPDVLTDSVFLPGVDPAVVRALSGARLSGNDDAMGIIETLNVPAAIQAADKGVKGAEVQLLEIRLADGLGGKGIIFFGGLVSNVEAAVELAVAAIPANQLVRQVVIPQIHEDIAKRLQANTRFGAQLGWDKQS